MCLAQRMGFTFLNLPKSHKTLFGEDQSRYLISVKDINKAYLDKFLRSNNIYFRNYGKFTNKNQILKFPDKSSIKLDYIRSTRKLWENKV